MKRWAIVLAVGGVAAVVAATAPGPQREAPARAACTPRWRVVAHTGLPNLSAILALSPSDVWAVGDMWANPPSSAIVHWDGHAVRRFSALGAQLNAVAAVAADDVWAVGASDRRGRYQSPRVVHWDGGSWKAVALPHLQQKEAYLADVVALSRSNVWAVGGVGNLDTELPLVLNWDGRAWHRFNLRRVGDEGNALWAIDAASADDIWAVGASDITSSHVEDWGGYGAHWDGRRWHEPSALEGGDEFTAVDAVSAHEVWTLGFDPFDENDFLERVDGRRRRNIFKLNTRDDLADLAVAGRNDVWLVGRRNAVNGPSLPLVVYWDGTRVIERTPFPSLDYARLNAVAALSTTDVWAAGDHLIARYSC